MCRHIWPHFICKWSPSISNQNSQWRGGYAQILLSLFRRLFGRSQHQIDGAFRSIFRSPLVTRLRHDHIRGQKKKSSPKFPPNRGVVCDSVLSFKSSCHPNLRHGPNKNTGNEVHIRVWCGSTRIISFCKQRADYDADGVNSNGKLIARSGHDHSHNGPKALHVRYLSASLFLSSATCLCERSPAGVEILLSLRVLTRRHNIRSHRLLHPTSNRMWKSANGKRKKTYYSYKQRVARSNKLVSTVTLGRKIRPECLFHVGIRGRGQRRLETRDVERKMVICDG